MNRILLCLIIISQNCFCQNDYKLYGELINRGNNSKNLDSICFFYKNAFGVAEPYEEDYIKMSLFCFNRKNLKESKFYILKSLEIGNILKKDLLDTLFVINYKESVKENLKFKKFTDSIVNKFTFKINKLRRKYLKKQQTPNSTSHNDIFEKLLQNEKYFQDLRFLFYDNKCQDSIAYNKISKYGYVPNSYLILNLLKQNKFPKRRFCYRFNEQTILMLLNHAITGFLNKKDVSQFLTLLWCEVETGNLSNYTYMCIYDHSYQCFINENKTFFGTVIQIDENNNKKIMDVFDPKNLNLRRFEFWGDRIECFSKLYNLDLPNNYEK